MSDRDRYGNLKVAVQQGNRFGDRQSGMQWTWDDAGNLAQERQPAWQRAVLPAMGALAAGVMLPAVLGGGGAAAGTAGASGTGSAAGAAGAAGGGWLGRLGLTWSDVLALGGQAYTAVNAARAEKKAAEQAAAGIEDAQAALSPYQNLGGQAANTLAGLMGFSTGGVGAGGGEMPTVTRTRPPDAPVTGWAVPREGNPPMSGQSLAAMSKSPSRVETPVSSYGSPEVLLVAPTGEQMRVPEVSVAHYLQRGARRVS